jgi:hypothetical protein
LLFPAGLLQGLAPALQWLLQDPLTCFAHATLPQHTKDRLFVVLLLPAGLLQGLAPALQWLLQVFPRRSVTGTAGAWLLLQELITSSSSSTSAAAAVGQQRVNAGSSTAAAAAVAVGQQPVNADLASSLVQLGPVLQAYIDQAYATHRHPSSGGAGKASGTGTPAKKVSKEGSGSSGGKDGSSGGGAEAPVLKSSNSAEAAAAAAAAAAVAAAEDGSWRYSHPVALTDDPSSSTFSSLLALLHCVQASMLTVPLSPAAAAVTESEDSSRSSAAAEQQQHQLEQPILPARAFLQIIAVANTWLQDQPSAAAASCSSSSNAEPVPPDHLQALPLKDVALAAACMLGIDSSAAALKYITRASEALSDGFFDLSVLRPGAAAAADADATTSSNAAAADLVDSVLGFKLLLEAIALLQRCGQCAWLALPLQQLSASAQGCSRQEMQQLVMTRGKLLLQVLSEYLMYHAPEGQKQQQQQPKQQQKKEEDEHGFEQQQEDAGSENAERCVLVAHVLIQMCPGRLAGAAGLLGGHGIVGEFLCLFLTVVALQLQQMSSSITAN